jgi:radical SAM superfamily enzyme YgiQ (UPF0313 family)
MKMKVALVSPPFLKDYMRNARCDFVSLSGTQWYPIWLGHLGALLESKGYDVLFIDAPAYRLSHEQTRILLAHFRPDAVVIYSGRLSEDNDIAFADHIVKELGIVGVFVGPYASCRPDQMLRKSQYVVRAVKGEFEYPVLELLEGNAESSIANLTYKNGDQVYSNAQRPLLSTKELDALPFVAPFFKKHLDFKRYKTVSEYYPFIDIMTGRGCNWGLCTYCLWVHTFIEGRTYQTRSVENVIEELKYVACCLPEIRSVMIQDDTLTASRAKILSEAIIVAGLKLTWSCYARANIPYDTLALMKKAGCRNLHVGYESASQEILNHIRKGLTKDHMTQFTFHARKAGLRIHGDFAIGFPGETIGSIRDTVQWACDMRPDTAQFQLMIPFPGTPFYDELNANGFLKDGMPNYPGASKEEMEKLVRAAYRKFYISLPYLKQVLKHPHELLFSRLDTYFKALPAMFWRKYQR